MNSETLVILGKGRSVSLGLMEARERQCECWGLNDQRYPELTRLFELHDLGRVGSETWYVDRRTNAAVKRLEPDDLQTLDCRVVTGERYGWLASAVYPYERIAREFCDPYCCNTVAHMLALAIYEGFEHIILAGVDYQTRFIYEAFDERPVTEHWLTKAQMRGALVQFPATANLFTQASLSLVDLFRDSAGGVNPMDYSRRMRDALQDVPKYEYSDEIWRYRRPIQ